MKKWSKVTNFWITCFGIIFGLVLEFQNKPIFGFGFDCRKRPEILDQNFWLLEVDFPKNPLDFKNLNGMQCLITHSFPELKACSSIFLAKGNCNKAAYKMMLKITSESDSPTNWCN